MNEELYPKIKGLVRCVNDRDAYFTTCAEIAKIFPIGLVEQLVQLVDGPVFDGDVVSKAHRDTLIDLGFAVRVCCKGEQGFTGAKYISYTVLKAINESSAK